MLTRLQDFVRGDKTMKALLNMAGRHSCTRIVLLLLTGFQALTCLGQLSDPGPIGYGDGVFHPGTNGYASLPAGVVQDLNYQQDFSVEVVLNIEACAAGGRWPNVLAKKVSPPLADAGFALSINQGQFKTVGQQIYASVADGAHQANVSSRSYQGIVHAVMTWNITTRELRLYANGAFEGSVTNTLINPANLKNSTDLKLAAPSSGQPLQRDILLARLWNRRLSDAEVANIWADFDTTGQHDLPADFDRSALVSEWLMQDLNDATHLKDSQGTNHLQLHGAAALWQANGPLVLKSPANGATGVPKSVTLKVAGGLGSLGARPVRPPRAIRPQRLAVIPVLPLQYQLQIDEANTFDSPALKSSGWLTCYGTWKPVLKPATQYYWRAQVRDSSLTSTPSGYTTTNSFVTKDANTWYVRPGVYTSNDGDTGAPIAKAGVYGTQDGTTYSNAWNGIQSIVWGEGGVEAGDTVYICGMHYYTMKSSSWVGLQGQVYIPESGYSPDYPITIRMDLATDPGTLWGAGVNQINGGGTWTGPDTNGVYSSADLRYPADYCLSGTNLVLLNRETAPTWQGDYGASFTTGGKWYVKMPDGGSPAGRVCTSTFGYQLNLGRSSNILFYNCRLYNVPPLNDIANFDARSDTQTQLPRSSHITFDGCDLRYNAEISLTQGNDHWTIRNSELSFGPYGVYTLLFNAPETGANYLTVENSYIHDMGTARFPHVDGHAVGVQGGDGHLVQGNRIENTGSAIVFWTGAQPMRNNTICYNFIKNIHIDQNSGDGIGISGDNTYSVPGLRTGFKVYGNIIMNTGIGGNQSWQGHGISCNSPDFVDIYNNVIYQCPTGIGLTPQNYPTQARVVNNIVVNSTNRFLLVLGTGLSTNLLIDYNLYFPAANASSAQFTVLYGSHDQHSIFTNPSFVSSAPAVATDFKLAPTSKAIGAGTPINPLYNFGGSPQVPDGVLPDIGAFEDFATYAQAQSAVGVGSKSHLKLRGGVKALSPAK
jgi:hypothetical protein